MLSHFTHGEGTRLNDNYESLLMTAAGVFARKGYMNTSIKDIAEENGMSPFLLQAKYPTTESIYKAVLLYIFDPEYYFSDCADLLEMLVVIIEELKFAVKSEDGRAAFISSLIHDDIPESVIDALKAAIRSSKLYPEFIYSMSMEQVIPGEVYEILRRFVVSSFEILEGFKTGKMAFPDNEFFLNIIQYSEDNDFMTDKALIKQQNSIIAAFASDYQGILFVDLDTDKIDVYHACGEYDNWILNMATRGFEEYKRKFLERFVFAEDKELFKQELDSERLKEKLEEEPVIYVDFRVLKDGEPVKYRAQIAIDPMYSFGNRILIGGQILH